MNSTKKTLAFSLLLCSSPAAAQRDTAVLTRQVTDYTALVEAERSKSTFCKTFVGKPAAVSAFDAAALRLQGPKPKGEYETTAQYQTRLAATPKPVGSVTLVMPADRDNIRYEADLKMIAITPSAFRTGRFSEEGQPEVLAKMATGLRHDGLEVPYSQSERLIRTSVGHNRLGMAVRIADKVRDTRALFLTVASLFPNTPRPDSWAMVIEASQAQAPRLKAALRTALVLDAAGADVVRSSEEGAAADFSNPNHYTENLTIITAKPRCALVLDAASRVLASADAG